MHPTCIPSCITLDITPTSQRPYLEQRDVAALVYLSDSNVDFAGGVLEFQHGTPTAVHACPGMLVCYPAAHVHRVTPVEWGSRNVLTMWLTISDTPSNEDTAILSALQGI